MVVSKYQINIRPTFCTYNTAFEDNTPRVCPANYLHGVKFMPQNLGRMINSFSVLSSFPKLSPQRKPRMSGKVHPGWALVFPSGLLPPRVQGLLPLFWLKKQREYFKTEKVLLRCASRFAAAQRPLSELEAAIRYEGRLDAEVKSL